MRDGALAQAPPKGFDNKGACKTPLPRICSARRSTTRTDGAGDLGASWYSACRTSAWVYEVWVFGIWGLGFRISGLGLQIWGFRFGV